MPHISSHSAKQVLRACFEVAADHFDPAILNPNAVVGTPGRDDALGLRGWNESASAWDCEDAAQNIIQCSRVFDPYHAKRIYRLLMTGQLSVYPWETRPIEGALLAPLVEEVLSRLQNCSVEVDEPKEESRNS